MNDFKTKLAPVLKMIEQLDNQTVMALTGVMLLLALVVGNVADLVAMVIGIWLGIAISKKLL